MAAQPPLNNSSIIGARRVGAHSLWLCQSYMKTTFLPPKASRPQPVQIVPRHRPHVPLASILHSIPFGDLGGAVAVCSAVTREGSSPFPRRARLMFAPSPGPYPTPCGVGTTCFLLVLTLGSPALLATRIWSSLLYLPTYYSRSRTIQASSKSVASCLQQTRKLSHLKHEIFFFPNTRVLDLADLLVRSASRALSHTSRNYC